MPGSKHSFFALTLARSGQKPFWHSTSPLRGLDYNQKELHNEQNQVF